MMKTLISTLLIGSFLLLVACGGHAGTPPLQPTLSPTNTVSSTFTIPADFITYNDSSGLFNISYPPYCEANLAIILGLNTNTGKIIDSVRSGVPLENTSVLFLAGVPNGLRYDPGIGIMVEPLSPTLHGIEAVADAEILRRKMGTSNYTEISRDFTVIDGREAAIVEYEAETHGIAEHCLLMVTTVEKTVWVVTCGVVTATTNFNDYRDDFQAIVHSLRVYD